MAFDPTGRGAVTLRVSFAKATLLTKLHPDYVDLEFNGAPALRCGSCQLWRGAKIATATVPIAASRSRSPTPTTVFSRAALRCSLGIFSVSTKSTVYGAAKRGWARGGGGGGVSGGG